MTVKKAARDGQRGSHRDHREDGEGSATGPEPAAAAAAGRVNVDGGRGLRGAGRLVQQSADGVLVQRVHRQFSSAGTGSSARRSALRPLAVWLFTVPGVQPSSAAVCSTGRSQ